MNKSVTFFLSIFYFFFAVVWAILYGMIAGFIFKIIATWEDFFVISNKEIRQWKRYSKRSYEKYINEKISAKKVKAYEIPTVREAIKKENTRQPFPIYNIVVNLIVAIILMPFRAIAGFIEGPMIVFDDFKHFWELRIVRKDPKIYYEELFKI